LKLSERFFGIGEHCERIRARKNHTQVIITAQSKFLLHESRERERESEQARKGRGRKKKAALMKRDAGSTPVQL
jgi:hypothetical protein